TLAGPGVLGLPSQGLAVLRGAFDPDALRAAADAQAKKSPNAFKAHDKGGQRVYEARGGDKDAPSAFACVLDKGTVVVGPSSASVLDAAARHAGKKTSQIDKELAGLLTKADTTQVLWAAGVGSKELRKELEQFPEARGFAGSVRSFAGGVSVTNGL